MNSKFTKPLRWKSFAIAKDGESADKCEDIVAGDPETGHFAISDGASESILTQIWGELLVNRHVEQPFDGTGDDWQTWLSPLRKIWWEEVQKIDDLPWWAEHKLGDGASSTFLGLVVSSSGDWTAISIGDSCIFHLRGEERWACEPIHSLDEFDCHPSLVGSKPRQDEPDPQRTPGNWESGDRFILMTDAIACWFLEQLEKTQLEDEQSMQPLISKWLEMGEDDSEFRSYVQKLIESREMKSDDVAVVIIEV